MKAWKTLSIVLVTLMAIGCANVGNKSMKNVTEDDIDTSIVAGQTTKAQIQGMFGSPFETTYTDGGLLIWTYRYDDTSALTPETIGSAVLTWGLLGTKSRGTRNELVVLFDENDVVKRFNMSNSPIEAGTGIF